jgi:hypothetical protein
MTVDHMTVDHTTVGHTTAGSKMECNRAGHMMAEYKMAGYLHKVEDRGRMGLQGSSLTHQFRLHRIDN